MFWLQRLGAHVCGYALAPSTQPSMFEELHLEDKHGAIGDITDAARMRATMRDFAPEVVFHLAAQAIVRASYDDPLETFHTNIYGTACVLDAARHTETVQAVVSVTSDKCYENREWLWGYRETDPLGGHDPYSASKAAAEIVTASMRSSFFQPARPQGHTARIASVRAGNVIGGGDWSRDRLVPDIYRACLRDKGAVKLRSPKAVRPWQHVLEPISAYLALAQKLYAREPGVDDSFNFGPDEGSSRPVIEVAEALINALGRGKIEQETLTNQPHEATLLRLDCSKARARLGWRPRLNFSQTIRMTADWYASYAQGDDVRIITAHQIDEFEDLREAMERSGDFNADH